MIEREIKLAAGPGFHLPDLGAIDPEVTTEPPEEFRMETVYHDTEDLRLARWGCSLRHRSKEGWTLKLPSDKGGPLLERTEITVPGPAKSPPAAVLEPVRAYLRRAPLQPVARLSTLRHRVRLVNSAGLRLAEVVDDEVSVLDGRRVAARFREIEVEVMPAGDHLLQPLLTRLRAAGAGPSDGTPKHVRAIGPQAAGPAEVAPAALPPKASIGEVVTNAIGVSVAGLLKHDPGVRLGGDAEHVHQARVSVRRLRSNLRTFDGLLDAEAIAPLRDELGTLGNELGGLRDREVLVERLHGRLPLLPAEDRRTASELLKRLQREIAQHRVTAVRFMDSSRYLDLLESLVQLARNPPLVEPGEADSGRSGALVLKPWRRLRRAVRELPEDDPPDALLHQIRIYAKRVRYAAEAVAPVAGKDAVQFAKAAAALQTVLGEHQDSVTAEAWLRSATASSSSVRRAYVAGELAALERAQALEMRSRWRATWDELDRRQLRAWMQ